MCIDLYVRDLTVLPLLLLLPLPSLLLVLVKLDQLEKHKLGLGKMQLNMLMPSLVKLLPLSLMLWGINLDLRYTHLLVLSLPPVQVYWLGHFTLSPPLLLFVVYAAAATAECVKSTGYLFVLAAGHGKRNNAMGSASFTGVGPGSIESATRSF